jgi:hypothetical protein
MRSTSYISEHRKKREKVRRYVFGTLAVFALYFIFLGGAWLVVRSPLFQLQHITVTGNNVIASQDVITLLESDPSGHHGFFGSVLGWNNMLSWPGSISKNQLDAIPQLASATVSKDYFSRTITVNVTERSPFGIWCFLPKGDDTDSGLCYWFDNTGVIFEKATNTEGNLIVVVHDHSQNTRGLNQKVLSDAFAANFISIVNVLHKSNVGIQEIDLNDLSLEEVDVMTTGGPELYFSLRFPADDDLGVLQSLITQGGFNKLQYVDCRTEDRVYYK